MRGGLSAAVAAVVLAWPAVPVAETGAGTPPTFARVEAPRDFGYHVGDPIPLTLVVETERGTAIDPDTLPRPGDAVGPFEIREIRSERSALGPAWVHRIHLVLQTFVPAADGPVLTFPSLELGLAPQGGRAGDSQAAHRTVTIPSHPFVLSPTAVGPLEPRPMKGAVVPRPGWRLWGSVGAGALCLALGGARLARDLARRRARRPREEPSPPEPRALRTLRTLLARSLAHEEATPFLPLVASAVLRRRLGEACGIPARARTLQQLREDLAGHPLGPRVAEMLARCNRIIYDGHRPTPAEKEELVQEVVVLIGRLERDGNPRLGGADAAR